MLKVVIKDRCVLKKWLYIYLVTQHIPTMTNSHHGGILSVMMMVGICQWQNTTIDYDDDD